MVVFEKEKIGVEYNIDFFNNLEEFKKTFNRKMFYTTMMYNKTSGEIIPTISKICGLYNRNKDKPFVIYLDGTMEDFKNSIFKVTPQTLKYIETTQAVKCKYMQGLNYTRFKKNNCVKFTTSWDILMYNYCDSQIDIIEKKYNQNFIKIGK
jgi:hypothetical protein